MSVLVVDASVALRASFPGEAGHREAAERFAEIVAAGVEVVAPEIYVYEVGNALRRTVGPGAERAAQMLEVLGLARIQSASLDILVRAQTSATKLSFYDAAYVALAEELGTLLWTEDRAILKAAPEIATDTANIRRRLRV